MHCVGMMCIMWWHVAYPLLLELVSSTHEIHLSAMSFCTRILHNLASLLLFLHITLTHNSFLLSLSLVGRLVTANAVHTLAASAMRMPACSNTAWAAACWERLSDSTNRACCSVSCNFATSGDISFIRVLSTCACPMARSVATYTCQRGRHHPGEARVHAMCESMATYLWHGSRLNFRNGSLLLLDGYVLRGDRIHCTRQENTRGQAHAHPAWSR